MLSAVNYSIFLSSVLHLFFDLKIPVLFYYLTQFETIFLLTPNKIATSPFFTPLLIKAIPFLRDEHIFYKYILDWLTT
jgi:hypothetical protein